MTVKIVIYPPSCNLQSHADIWQLSNNSRFLAAPAPTGACTNKWILGGDIGTFSWNFIHKAKTNCLSVNAKPMFTGERRLCRRCHRVEETMSHAIQSCKLNMSMVTDRHDASQQIIYNHLKNPDYIVIMNESCSYVKDCNLRIDISSLMSAVK